MLDLAPSIFPLAFFIALSLLYIFFYLKNDRPVFWGALQVAWFFSLVITISEWISFPLALWVLAILSFYVLREFFSLVAVRIEDRLAILSSYLAIPFLFYLIYIGWYGLFIIAIPVYFFLIIPFAVALGRNSTGIVFSIGIINFGLFFYVFCFGHFGYLVFYSERMAALLILSIAVVGSIYRFEEKLNTFLQVAISIVLTSLIFSLSSEWSGIPLIHSLSLGVLLPLVAYIGHFTFKECEKDLGISPDKLLPGRGKYIEATKLYLFTAPVAFHYLRWFLDWGDL